MAMILLVAAATQLADAVFKASGGENWPNVRAIQFTFNVSEGEQLLLAAQHVWDVEAGKDTVTWNGKTVTVDVRSPAQDDDSKAAYARWVNDSYWLLAPLKLKDAGVHVRPLGDDSFEVSFEQVGLTPGDRYVYYIDRGTNLPRAWDYMPASDKKLGGTWERYREIGGLTLATEHQFAGKRIWFSDLDVTTK